MGTPKLQLSRMNIDDVPVTPSTGSSFQPTPKFDVSLPSPAPPTPATPAPISSDSDVDKMKHPSGIVPTLQNIVSTVSLGCTLNLKDIALKARNAEYNPRRFAAVIMRIREPRTTALIFASGKMVCTGAKSEELSKLAARKYARVIQKLGFPVKFTDFKIQNIVGSCGVQFPIKLEDLAIAHSRYCNVSHGVNRYYTFFFFLIFNCYLKSTYSMNQN